MQAYGSRQNLDLGRLGRSLTEVLLFLCFTLCLQRLGSGEVMADLSGQTV